MPFGFDVRLPKILAPKPNTQEPAVRYHIEVFVRPPSTSPREVMEVPENPKTDDEKIGFIEFIRSLPTVDESGSAAASRKGSNDSGLSAMGARTKSEAPSPQPHKKNPAKPLMKRTSASELLNAARNRVKLGVARGVGGLPDQEFHSLNSEEDEVKPETRQTGSDDLLRLPQIECLKVLEKTDSAPANLGRASSASSTSSNKSTRRKTADHDVRQPH